VGSTNSLYANASVAHSVLGRVMIEAREGLDHRLVHLAGGSKASRRKALIGQPRSQLSLRLHLVLGQTMIKAHGRLMQRSESHETVSAGFEASAHDQRHLDERYRDFRSVALVMQRV
jgi:hypothetical protein